MTLYIKNMVCPRCIEAVRRALLDAGVAVKSVALGEAEIDGELTDAAKTRLAERLGALGFELLEDRRSRIIESVKNCLIERLMTDTESPDARLSEFVARKLGLDYKYVSNLFSETEGRTIEHYYIALKIERVKELLVYDELTLSEIAFRLGYSSVAHLSAQFKRFTGIAPSRYKHTGDKKRRPLDDL